MVRSHGGQMGRWCHVGSAAIRLWCDGLVAWRADTSAESSTVAAICPAVRWSGHMAGRWVAGVMRVPLLSACGATVRSHDKPIPRVLGRQIPVTPLAVTPLAVTSGRQPLTVSATAPSAWPYVRWCRNWTAKHRLPLLPVRVCPVLPTPRVSDVRFLHYRR